MAICGSAFANFEELWAHRTQGLEASAWVQFSKRSLQAENAGAATGRAGWGRIMFDLSKVDNADGGVIALLVELREELDARGLEVELVGANPWIEANVQLHSGRGDAARHSKSESENAVARLGRAVLGLRSEAVALLDFVGNMVLAGICLVLFRAPTPDRRA